jgi:hypothetical protein
MSAERSEQQATVYGAACIEKCHATRALEEKHGIVVEKWWTDANIEFQKLSFNDWILNGAVVTERKQLFRSWIEDSEWDWIEKESVANERELLEKYKGMRWLEDEELFVAWSDAMEFQGGCSGMGYCLIGRSERDSQMVSYPINEVIDLILEYVQPTDLNVEVVVNIEKRAANIAKKKEMEEKKAKEVEKRKAAELKKLTQR